jgi:hypothetical protein
MAYRKPRPTAQERIAKRNLEAISLEVPIKSRSYSMVKTTERYRVGARNTERQIRNGNAWNKGEVKFSRFLGKEVDGKIIPKGRNITTVTSAFGEHYE